MDGINMSYFNYIKYQQQKPMKARLNMTSNIYFPTFDIGTVRSYRRIESKMPARTQYPVSSIHSQSLITCMELNYTIAIFHAFLSRFIIFLTAQDDVGR